MRPRFVLAALVLGWALLLSVLGLWKYAVYRADVDDGIFTQVLLSFGQGFSSTAEGGVNHFSVHFSPMLVTLVPFVRWIGDARALVVAQAVLCALVAIPVYAIARRRTGEWTALSIAAIALCYPPLCAAAFGDFHEAAFVPLFAAALAWAIDAGKTRAALLAALALCCTKEDEFAIVGAIGVIVALAWRGDRARVRLGITLSAIGAGAALLYFGILHPLLFPRIPYFSMHFYNWAYTGPSPQGFAPLSSPLRIEYLWWALLPLLFIPLRSRIALLTIPGFVEVLASHEAITISLTTHYVTSWLGYMLAAFAVSAADLASGTDLRSRALVAAAPVACVLTLLFHDPMARWYYLYRLPNAQDAALSRVLAALPPEASVGADDEIFAHIAGDPNAALGANGEQFLVFDANHDSRRWSFDAPAIQALVRSGSYHVTYDRGGIVVLER